MDFGAKKQVHGHVYSLCMNHYHWHQNENKAALQETALNVKDLMKKNKTEFKV